MNKLSTQTVKLSVRHLRLLGEYKYPNQIKITRTVKNIMVDSGKSYGFILFNKKRIDVKRTLPELIWIPV